MDPLQQRIVDVIADIQAAQGGPVSFTAIRAAIARPPKDADTRRRLDEAMSGLACNIPPLVQMFEAACSLTLEGWMASRLCGPASKAVEHLLLMYRKKSTADPDFTCVIWDEVQAVANVGDESFYLYVAVAYASDLASGGSYSGSRGSSRPTASLGRPLLFDDIIDMPEIGDLLAYRERQRHKQRAAAPAGSTDVDQEHVSGESTGPRETAEHDAPMAIVLTALRVEYLAVRSLLIDLVEVVHEQGTVYEVGTLSRNERSCRVALAEVGAGNPSAAAEAERAVAYFKPTVALFVGVAGGIKDVSIGDVVAATKVYGYESGKVSANFEARAEVYRATYAITQRAQAEARKDDWRTLAGGTLATAHVGAIAAGEKVVADRASEIFRFLRTQYSDALAVEMEGRGFLTATHAYPGIQALVVRGISDLIDGKAAADREGSQAAASKNAAAFALHVLDRFANACTPETSAPSALGQAGGCPSPSGRGVSSAGGHEDRQLALKVLKAHEQLRDQLSVLRHPMVLPAELEGRERAPGEDIAKARDKDAIFAYEKRLKTLLLWLPTLEDAHQDARARWGKDAEHVLCPIVQKVNHLTMVAWPTWRDAMSGRRDHHELLSVFKEPYLILYSVPGHDDFGATTASAIDAAGAFLRQCL